MILSANSLEGAVHSNLYYGSDSTEKVLILRKKGAIKKKIYAGDELKFRLQSEYYPRTGKVDTIHTSYLIINGEQILLKEIEWLKVKKKETRALSVLKWAGIVVGAILLTMLAFIILFAIAYAGGNGIPLMLGILFIGGISTLYGKMVSRKKFRLRKYQLTVQKIAP
jgi:hypothetical protein